MNERNKSFHPAKKDFSTTGLALLAVGGISVAAQLLFSVIWGVLTVAVPSLSDASWALYVVTFVPLYCIAMPIGVSILRKIPAEPQPRHDLRTKELLQLLLMCFPLMYGGNIIGNVLSMLLSGGQAQNGLLNYIMDVSFFSILVTVVLAPLLEEYIFRKQIIDRLSKYGEKTVIFFSGLTFALFHMNLFQFFYALALGILFAFVYTRTGKLRYPVILHMIINFNGSVLAPWLLSILDMDALTQMAEGTMDMTAIADMLPALALYYGYSFLLIGASLAGLILLLVHREKFVLKPAAQELPKEGRFKTVFCNTGLILFFLFCLLMSAINLLAA